MIGSYRIKNFCQLVCDPCGLTFLSSDSGRAYTDIFRLGFSLIPFVLKELCSSAIFGDISLFRVVSHIVSTEEDISHSCTPRDIFLANEVVMFSSLDIFLPELIFLVLEVTPSSSLDVFLP